MRRVFWQSRSTPRAALAAAAVAMFTLALTSCGGSSPTTPSGLTATGTDDGTHLTMWIRDATQAETKALVDGYNSSHKNQVDLTVIPTDSYQQKVGTAAGGGQLPDLFSSDVVFSPNYSSKGLWLDITSGISALPFSGQLSTAAIKAGTYKGKEYVIPLTIDTSVLFYNKGLYQKAGLDPSQGPKTLTEFASQATAISKLGNGVYGTYYGGNCGGCLGFTWWPSMWADGLQVLNADGTAANFDDPKSKAVFDLYRGLYEHGITAPGAKQENGATWVGAFTKGNIGIMAMPSSTLGSMPASIDIGVAPIPGITGGQSTFVGGDVLGISAKSSHANQAWNFLAWSLGKDAQVNILAKGHYQLARTDLASNQYSSADPRLVTINSLGAHGVTPFSLNFGQTFNDPNGPWVKLLQDVLFGDESKLSADNAAISKSLAGG